MSAPTDRDAVLQKYEDARLMRRAGDHEGADRVLGRQPGAQPPPDEEPASGRGNCAAPACPEVLLSGRQLDEIVEDAVAALRAANDPPELFERAGLPSRIRRDEHGTSVIATLGESGLVEALARAARWTRRERGRDGSTKTLEAHPTRSLAGVVLAGLGRRAGALPPLRGIVEAPYLRPDGALVEHEGYHPPTGLYLALPPGLRLAPVPDHPTEPELRAATALVGSMLEEFPFRGDADRATAWALVLTIAVRTVIDGPAPLFLIDAPSPGTGKTLIARSAATLATGRGPALMAPPGDRDDAETRKRITSALLLGTACVAIDNLEKPIASAALAAVLTSDRWTDRMLGRSELVTLPARSVWLATGNNLRLRGDLPRRAVWCRLDAQLARPWTREGFRRPDLIGWVAAHRSELLAGVYTMARAWIDAGRPGPDHEGAAAVPRMGGFEAWRHVVGGVLLVAGVPGFLANLPELYDVADEDTPAWAGFLAAWTECFDEPVTAGELAAAIASGGKLRDSLPGEIEAALEAKGSFTRRLGRALARKEETRFAIGNRTLRLTRRGTAQRSIRWGVASEVS